MQHKKRRVDAGGTSVELNVMPFIDIFSLLCTFLLFSAVFVSIGILEVQAPYLTNAAPDKSVLEDKDKKKEILINIDIKKDQVVLRSLADGEKESITKFSVDKESLDKFHAMLLALKQKFPTSEKATVYSDDDVEFSQLVSILDAVKFLETGKPQEHAQGHEHIPIGTLFPKIIIGSVLL